MQNQEIVLRKCMIVKYLVFNLFLDKRKMQGKRNAVPKFYSTGIIADWMCALVRAGIP